MLRTCDAVGAWLAVPELGHEWHRMPEEHVEAADLCVEIPMIGQGASLNVAVVGSNVLYRLAGMA